MALEVWLDDAAVGRLRHDGASGRFEFRYFGDWETTPRRYPLSPTIPFDRPAGQTDEQHSVVVRQFFENLLPEGEALDHAAAASGVTKANLAGLLAALGRETSGALRIVPPDGHHAWFPPLRPLPREELSARIRDRARQPFSVWDGSVRLSIAGYQDKIAVYVDGEDWLLVDGPQMASTHIVKPAPARPELADLPFNEFFCMRLARRIGLDVAQVDLHRVPEPVLFVERFDRVRLEDGRVRRLHVINVRQALGKPPAGEGHSDVTDAERFSLLRHSPQPLIDRRGLVRRTLFRQLIGSGDAAADNLCFFADHGGLRLAPAFGLASVKVAPAAGIDDWDAFARDCDIAPRSLALEMKRLCELLPTQALALAAELDDQVPRHVTDGLLEGINEKARRMAGFAFRG